MIIPLQEEVRRAAESMTEVQKLALSDLLDVLDEMSKEEATAFLTVAAALHATQASR